MSREIINKKLEQIRALLDELGILLGKPCKDFVGDSVAMRAAERNFQLVVDTASDINTHILIEKGGKSPDTYSQSFQELAREKIIALPLAKKLVLSARLRNVIVHEYDLEEDPEKFFKSAKGFVPAYREYLKIIYRYAEKV